MKYYVKLKFFATLAHMAPDNLNSIPINPGTTVKDLMLNTGIKTEDIKLIFINSVLKPISTKLQNGDEIGIFPPVGGG